MVLPVSGAIEHYIFLIINVIEGGESWWRKNFKNPDYVMSMLGAGTSEGADKKVIGELKMGCFNRPLCVRSPDFVIASPKNLRQRV